MVLGETLGSQSQPSRTMKRNDLLLIFLLTAVGFATEAATTTMFSPLTSFGPSGNGLITPPATDPYPTLDPSGPKERGLAYDPTTGYLVLVDPNTDSTGTIPAMLGPIFVFDGLTGTNISTLSTNGMYGGTYPASAAGIADDGTVYVCNQNNNTSVPFVIYSWTNIWQSNSPPYLAFSNTIPINQRYGATMAVRGSGTNTQLLLGSKVGTTGTNVLMFTTTDGFNFTVTPLATDTKGADFADGIAFGPGDTFWAKSVSGHPLRLMSFDLATSNAVTLATFDTNALPATANLGPLAVDTNNNRLAAIEVVSATAAPQRVWLYDISPTLADHTKPPVLLDIASFATQNSFATAPNGFLCFNTNGSLLYAHALNNGLMAQNVSPVPTPTPIITNQPAPSSVRLLQNQGVRWEVLAYPTVTYQWQKDGTNVPGATNAVFSIASTAFSDSGTYSVTVSNAAGTLTSSNVVLQIVNPTDLYHLNRLWSVGPADSQVYLNSSGGSGTPNQRTLAYNSLSNELYIVSRAGAVYSIYAINATNFSATPPPVIKSLNTSGISGGSLTLVAIGVNADGYIYACNVDNTGAWKLYQWTNSDPATVPQLVYGPGDPASQGTPPRWGDVMDVRGSGPDTQIIIDSQVSSSSAPGFVSVLSPSDSYMTNFTPAYNLLNTYNGSTLIGRSLQWGVETTNTFWQKRRGTRALESLYDFSASGSISFSNAYAGSFPANLGPVWMDFTRNLLIGIRTNTPAASTLDLYDITVPTAPIYIASYAFPASPAQANGNFIGQCLISGDYVFAIAGNNGVMGFKLLSGPPTAPVFITQPQNLRLIQGGSGTLSVLPDQVVTSYQWQQSGTNLAGATTSTYAINNAHLTNAGDYLCIVTNTYGAATSAVATVTVTLPGDAYTLSPIGNIAPGVAPFITANGANTPNERSFAYNALSNQLIIVQCAPSATNFAVYVVDANNPGNYYTLNTNGIVHEGNSEVSGANPVDLTCAAVADDGAVYICNLSPNASGGASFDPTKMFRVYRWADSGATTAPTNVFAGDPAGQTSNYRWGDAMSVHGSGTNTQILLDANQGTFGAVLIPTDDTLTSFTNYWWAGGPGAGSIGRSLQFYTNNSILEKRKGAALKLSTFDTNAQTSTLVGLYPGFSLTQGGITLDPALNLAAGVDFNGTANTPDTVALYEISDLSAPLLIARYDFPTNQQANANFICQTVIAGSKVYALDANNGLVAFTIVAPANLQPTVAIAGAEVHISWPTNFPGYSLYSTPSLASPITWTFEGAGAVVGAQFVVTNTLSTNDKFYRLQKP